MSSSPGSVGLARAHPLTKTQAMEPSRQTWSSYGPPYPLGRWSSVVQLSNLQNVRGECFNTQVAELTEKVGWTQLLPCRALCEGVLYFSLCGASYILVVFDHLMPLCS